MGRRCMGLVQSSKVPEFQVPGFKFQVPGSRFQVPGSRFQVPGSKDNKGRKNFPKSIYSPWAILT